MQFSATPSFVSRRSGRPGAARKRTGAARARRSEPWLPSALANSRTSASTDPKSSRLPMGLATAGGCSAMPAIDLDGVAIAYREFGAGTPVILLHSSASSSRQWQSLVERLQPRHRVFSVDLHGYGDSGTWHGGRAFTLADEAAVVVALAQQLDAPAHIVGHSYGGAVA